METKDYNVQEGMAYATSILKSTYLATLMKNPTSGANVISCLANGFYTSLIFYYTPDGVKYLQSVLNDVVASLAKVSITSEPQSEEQFPLCYGEDYVSKFKVLGKVIKLPYLFQTLLGKSKKWKDMHLSQKSEVRYYNRLSDEDLKQINSGIRTIVINLASINFVYDEELFNTMYQKKN